MRETFKTDTNLGFSNLLALGLACLVLPALLPGMAMAKDPIYTGFFSSKAVGGYDVVAYFTQSKPTKGKSAFTTEYEGAKWQFANQEHLDLFRADPKKYAPQYGGYCAWAVAQGSTASARPDLWTIVDGKLYLNYNDSIQEKWEADIPGFIAAGDKNWPMVIQ